MSETCKLCGDELKPCGLAYSHASHADNLMMDTDEYLAADEVFCQLRLESRQRKMERELRPRK